MEYVRFKIGNQFIFSPKLRSTLPDIKEAFFYGGRITDYLSMQTKTYLNKVFHVCC